MEVGHWSSVRSLHETQFRPHQIALKSWRFLPLADGHPVHKARSVRRWLTEHAAQIQIFWLPPYSPELNPDELLNQDVKTNALGRIQKYLPPALPGQT
jgi:transposase